MTLTGSCARCGLCCTIDRAGVRYVCAHLRRWPWSRLGDAEATECAVYAERLPFMPITMRAPDGSTFAARCAPSGSPEEAACIAPHLDRGCSLTVAG